MQIWLPLTNQGWSKKKNKNAEMHKRKQKCSIFKGEEVMTPSACHLSMWLCGCMCLLMSTEWHTEPGANSGSARWAISSLSHTHTRIETHTRAHPSWQLGIRFNHSGSVGLRKAASRWEDGGTEKASFAFSFTSLFGCASGLPRNGSVCSTRFAGILSWMIAYPLSLR